MQRRRAAVQDDSALSAELTVGSVSSSISDVARNGITARSDNSRRHGKHFDLRTASLCLLVCLVMQVGFFAYQMLTSKNHHINISDVYDVQSVRSGNRDGLPAALSLDKKNPMPQLQQQQQQPKQQEIDQAAIPIKQPTPSHKSSSSYEPTNYTRKRVLREAIAASTANARFWNEITPESVPPLKNITGLPPVIAYVTTLTKCSSQRGSMDGAAVLLHSIRRNSHGWIPMQEQSSSSQFDSSVWPKYGGKGGRYRYRAYVIVDPAASPTIKGKNGDCARFLQSIGYVVLHRPPLVPLFEIRTPENNDAPVQSSATFAELQKYGYVGVQRPKTGETALPPGEHPNKLGAKMYINGCCGYTELLKLHAYGLVEHELAVHFDFDSLVLRPMDDLFDVMLGKQKNDKAATLLSIAKLPKSKPVDFSRPIDAAFTRDYNSVVWPKLEAPVGFQGGFLVVRPSLSVLERYRRILQRGEFGLNPRSGWGGLGKHGGFYGDLTFQGILPYYYEDFAPPGEHNELELDRCVYNQMADNPRKSTYKFPRATPLDPKVMGFRDTNKCRDGRKDCSDTDCQRTHPKDSVTAHFTFCKKPWDCSDGLPGTVALDTCLGLLSEWFGVRRELEDWWLLPRNESYKAIGDDIEDILQNQRSFYSNKKTIQRVHETREGTMQPDLYRGYCEATGASGYHQLMGPDGLMT